MRPMGYARPAPGRRMTGLRAGFWLMAPPFESAPTLPRHSGPVLNDLYLARRGRRQRHMRARPRRQAPEGFRCQPAEGSKLAREVRLIAVSGGERQRAPAGGGLPLQELQRALQAREAP